MGKVLIGNVRGPQGVPGMQGDPGADGERGVRGSRWVSGIAITGISTEPVVFATGIIDAMPNDHYLNIKTGNVYRCHEGGDENTATWVFLGNILGSIPIVEDTLESDSTTNALSAAQGKFLYELVEDDYKELEKLMEDVTYYGTFKDENSDETLLMYMISKVRDEKRIQVFPISHAKAIWWDKKQEVSLYDKVKGFESRVKTLEENKESIPKVHYGVEEPDASIGEDGDIYIQIIEE